MSTPNPATNDCSFYRRRRIAMACAAAVSFLIGLDRESAFAADLSSALPSKAPPPAVLAAYDWSGFYLGGNAGYAFGGSDWTSAQAGVPSVAGAFDFSNGYNLSSGTGSYFLGFQAGYDYMTASRWLFGVQADVS